MLYFDESGNSGDNLLDEGQPSYLLLSHDYTDEEVKLILDPLLRVSKAHELHFKTIKKYSSQRKALIECLSNGLIQPERIFFYAAHKRFMIVIHMVDKLVETLLYHHDIDIYKEGLNLSTANILYIMGNNAWDKALFNNMCKQFVKWMGYPDAVHRKAFYDVVKDLGSTLTGQDKDLLSLIQHSEPFAEQIEESLDTYSIDATLSCFVAHCDHWAKRYGGPFDVTVDDSKQLEYWNEMIRFLTKELPVAEVGYGSRKHKYPLLIDSVQQVASKDSRPIQLADLLASSLNQFFANKIGGLVDDFTQMIIATPLKEIIGNQMWPTTAVTPEELDMLDTSGQNPLDFLADVAIQKSEQFEKANRQRKT
jgi:hypothetical protein